MNLSIHSWTDYNHDIIVNPALFPDLQVGDVVHVYHRSSGNNTQQQDPSSQTSSGIIDDNNNHRLILVITTMKSMRGRYQVSICNEIMSSPAFQLRRYQPIIIEKISTTSPTSSTDNTQYLSVGSTNTGIGLRELYIPLFAAAGYVEFFFKDTFVSQSRFWRFRKFLKGQAVYVGKTLSFGGVNFRVDDVLCEEKHQPMVSGIVTESTKLIFRSGSARIFWLIQISREMWDFIEEDGDMFHERLINRFIPEVLEQWMKKSVKHMLTVVFFSRTFFDSMEDGTASGYPKQMLHTDYDGRCYVDFYRVALQNVDYSNHPFGWIAIIPILKQEISMFPRYCGWEFGSTWPSHGGSSDDSDVKRSRGVASRASEGNILEAVNLALNILDKHYIDRELSITGQAVVLMTPGPGVFEVDRVLTNITKLRMMDNSIGCDVVSLAKAPLHIAPLFIFKPKYPVAPGEALDLLDQPHPYAPRRIYRLESDLGSPNSASTGSNITPANSNPAEPGSIRTRPVNSQSKEELKKPVFNIPHWIHLSFPYVKPAMRRNVTEIVLPRPPLTLGFYAPSSRIAVKYVESSLAFRAELRNHSKGGETKTTLWRERFDPLPAKQLGLDVMINPEEFLNQTTEPIIPYMPQEDSSKNPQQAGAGLPPMPSSSSIADAISNVSTTLDERKRNPNFSSRNPSRTSFAGTGSRSRGSAVNLRTQYSTSAKQGANPNGPAENIAAIVAKEMSENAKDIDKIREEQKEHDAQIFAIGAVSSPRLMLGSPSAQKILKNVAEMDSSVFLPQSAIGVVNAISGVSGNLAQPSPRRVTIQPSPTGQTFARQSRNASMKAFPAFSNPVPLNSSNPNLMTGSANHRLHNQSSLGRILGSGVVGGDPTTSTSMQSFHSSHRSSRSSAPSSFTEPPSALMNMLRSESVHPPSSSSSDLPLSSSSNELDTNPELVMRPKADSTPQNSNSLTKQNSQILLQPQRHHDESAPSSMVLSPSIAPERSQIAFTAPQNPGFARSVSSSTIYLARESDLIENYTALTALSGINENSTHLQQQQQQRQLLQQPQSQAQRIEEAGAFIHLFNLKKIQRELNRQSYNRSRWAHLFPQGKFQDTADGKETEGEVVPLTIESYRPNWKSLVSPGIVPLTTEFAPSEVDLRKDYTSNNHSLVLTNFSAGTTPEDAINELVELRFAQDFQLVVRKTASHVQDHRQLQSQQQALADRHYPVGSIPSSASSMNIAQSMQQQQLQSQSSATSNPISILDSIKSTERKTSNPPTIAPSAAAAGAGGVPPGFINMTSAVVSAASSAIPRNPAMPLKPSKSMGTGDSQRDISFELTMGHTIHVVRYTNGMISVVRHVQSSSKKKFRVTEWDYSYYLWDAFLGISQPVHHSYKPNLINYKWDILDLAVAEAQGFEDKSGMQVPYRRQNYSLIPLRMPHNCSLKDLVSGEAESHASATSDSSVIEPFCTEKERRLRSGFEGFVKWLSGKVQRGDKLNMKHAGKNVVLELTKSAKKHLALDDDEQKDYILVKIVLVTSKRESAQGTSANKSTSSLISNAETSDRTDWLILRLDKVFSMYKCFHIEVQWMLASGVRVAEFLLNLKKVSQKFNLVLKQTPEYCRSLTPGYRQHGPGRIPHPFVIPRIVPTESSPTRNIAFHDLLIGILLRPEAGFLVDDLTTLSIKKPGNDPPIRFVRSVTTGSLPKLQRQVSESAVSTSADSQQLRVVAMMHTDGIAFVHFNEDGITFVPNFRVNSLTRQSDEEQRICTLLHLVTNYVTVADMALNIVEELCKQAVN